MLIFFQNKIGAECDAKHDGDPFDNGWWNTEPVATCGVGIPINANFSYTGGQQVDE